MRIKVNWLVIALTSLPMLAVGSVLFFAGLRSDPRAMTDDGLLPLRTFFFLMSAFFVVLTVSISGGMLIFAFLRDRRLQRLEETGIRGKATILQMHETGTYVNNQPQVWMELQVDLTGRSPYFVEKRMVVPYTRIGQLRTGAVMDVMADPDRLDKPGGIELLLK